MGGATKQDDRRREHRPRRVLRQSLIPCLMLAPRRVETISGKRSISLLWFRRQRDTDQFLIIPRIDMSVRVRGRRPDNLSVKIWTCRLQESRAADLLVPHRSKSRPDQLAPIR